MSMHSQGVGVRGGRGAGRRGGRMAPVAAAAAVLALLAGASVSRSESPDPGLIRPDLVTVRISPRILTHDLAAQLEPAISRNFIVYTDHRNGQADIYLWDLGTDPNREVR